MKLVSFFFVGSLMVGAAACGKKEQAAPAGEPAAVEAAKTEAPAGAPARFSTSPFITVHHRLNFFSPTVLESTGFSASLV